MKIQVHQVLISLLIGLVLGFGAGQWQARDSFGPGHWKKGNMKQRMVEKMSRELQLSAEQKTQVQAILEAKHPQMMALHEEMRPKFEALRNTTHEEIRKVLNPEQQVKFDAFSKKHEERRKMFREKFKF
jgi:Spy/CpxP family protein refolding chaperone